MTGRPTGFLRTRLGIAVLVTAGVAALALGSCAPSAAPAMDSEERSIAISTTACGYASATVGSGVLIGGDLVLTAAHVVIGAGTIELNKVDDGTGGAARDSAVDARIVVIDPTRDLALVSARGLYGPAIELADARVDQPIVVVGGATSGSRAGIIQRKLDFRVDDVRAATRSTRSGYEIAVDLRPGDSGAGVYDNDDKLVGIVFSAPKERDGRTFVVDDSEIEAIIAAPTGDWSCDPSQHRVVQNEP